MRFIRSNKEDILRGVQIVLALVMVVLLVPAGVAVAQDSHGEESHGEDDHSGSRFSDKPIPLADLPDRPKPIIELGEPFLGTGTLKEGITLPTGAVWQPAFLAYGNIRSALQTINQETNATDVFGDPLDNLKLTEAAFRFDLFGNLYLTSSERVLVGIRPLDEGGNFTRYTLDTNINFVDEEGNPEEDFVDELNFGVRTLFFEGDFGEIFPALDWDDGKGLDIGISVGRQPLSFQDGMLINEDAIDVVGLTKANMRIGKFVNFRATAIFGWGDIDRPVGRINVADASIIGSNVGDDEAMLVGLFTEIDTRKSTHEVDVIYVASDEIRGSGFYAGWGRTRRFGRFNNTLRAVASFPTDEEAASTGSGVLFSNLFSWTPHHTHNHVYINSFLGLGEFRSAARGPASGGPIGNTGILFASVGLGRVPAPLGSLADDAFGIGVGYQLFFAHTRQQLIVEVGGRTNFADIDDLGDNTVIMNDALAGGARYQIALARRGVIVVDAIGAFDVDTELLTLVGRLELVVKL